MIVDGKKVNLQLWDQGQSKSPESTFQPLFPRHVSGCIIVANTSTPDNIRKALNWKRCFDERTKIKNESSIPCTLFINHDVPIQKVKDSIIPNSLPLETILVGAGEAFQIINRTPTTPKISPTKKEPSFDINFSPDTYQD